MAILFRYYSPTAPLSSRRASTILGLSVLQFCWTDKPVNCNLVSLKSYIRLELFNNVWQNITLIPHHTRMLPILSVNVKLMTISIYLSWIDMTVESAAMFVVITRKIYSELHTNILPLNKVAVTFIHDFTLGWITFRL